MGAFKIDPAQIQYVGKDLSRPECVIAERDGTLWVSDNRGAFTRIDPDGGQQLLGTMGGKPNGMAMGADGCIYMANIAHWKFYKVRRDGAHEVLLDTLDGKPVGAANFVLRGPDETLWLSVSSTHDPHLEALDRDIPDGYVIKWPPGGQPHVVVRGLLFTNEVRVSPDGRWLCMAETRAGRVSRAPIAGDGSIGKPQVFGDSPLGPGALTDGVAYDCEGGLWVTDIVGNRIFRIDPQGRSSTVFEDPDGEILDHPSSITFAGPDLKTVLVGSLTMSKLASFRSPVAGQPLQHWFDAPGR